jgi:hypothetical protein
MQDGLGPADGEKGLHKENCSLSKKKAYSFCVLSISKQQLCDGNCGFVYITPQEIKRE